MASHVAGAFSAVRNIVDGIHSVATPQFCEFEMRLGRIARCGGKKDEFVPGVDAAFVGSLLCKLETSNVWTDVTPWTQIVDRFYLLPSGLQVRTSSQAVYLKRGDEDVEDDEDEEDENAEDVDLYGDDTTTPKPSSSTGPPMSAFSYETSHIIKTAVSHVDLKWEGEEDRDMLRGKDGTTYGMRIGLKHEAPVFEDELQECVEETNTVRIKQRRSFRYTPAGKDRVHWAIDITQVWQSTTYTEAMERLRRGDEPHYEVEIECLDVYDYLKAIQNDSKRLSLSMLLKASDLFGITSDSPCRLVVA